MELSTSLVLVYFPVFASAAPLKMGVGADGDLSDGPGPVDTSPAGFKAREIVINGEYSTRWAIANAARNIIVEGDVTVDPKEGSNPTPAFGARDIECLLISDFCRRHLLSRAVKSSSMAMLLSMLELVVTPPRQSMYATSRLMEILLSASKSSLKRH
ncbi:hypothetical protein ACEPAH_1898 [Sanghuangporus vaninii]